jgi:1-deoxy-D-xylulose-5-phosphate reductoisomerase
VRFPGLRLAWEALAAAPGTTAVLNAANEVAVEAFLAGGCVSTRSMRSTMQL